MASTSFVQIIVPFSHVYAGGPALHFLKETGFGETVKEAVFCSRESMGLRGSLAWLGIPDSRKEADVS